MPLLLEIGAAPLRRHPVVLLGRENELAWSTREFARRRVLAIYGWAGIGKTSLLLAAASEQARRVGGTVAYHPCAEGERIGSVLASWLAHEQPAVRKTSLRAALDAVVDWARRTPLVLCIDDAHRITDPLLLDVLAHLGAAPVPLWLIVASRRQLALPEADIDGAALRVGPLPDLSARALWDDLEDRFGPSIGRFDALDPARRCSPFALRRAFATGQLGDEHGVDLTGLGPEQAGLLAQICAFRGPVDVDRLAALIPDRIAVLPALLQALLVEVTHDGSIAVHDLVRAAVAGSSRPASAADHRVCLAYHGADSDRLTRLRHTVGSEQWSVAAQLIDDIVKPQYGLFPMGAAVETEVLAAFAAVKRAGVELSLPLRLAQLQLAARHGEGRAVLEALRGEAARAPAAWAHLATVELVLGDSAAAETHVRQALAVPSPAPPPIARAFLLGVLIEVLRRQGQVAELRSVLEDFKRVAAQCGPIGAAVTQVMLAAISYDLEDLEDAAARLASARPCISLLSFAPTLQAMHALLERACAAGLVRSPDEVPPPSMITRALFEDVDFLRATLLLFAADGDLLEGNIAEADARARDAQAIAERRGYRGMQQWAMSTRAEVLRMRGLAAAAAELAEQALADPLTAVHRRQRVLLLAISALSLAQLGRMPEARQTVGSLDDFVHAPTRAARLSILPWIEPPKVESELARAELALAQLERSLASGRLDQAQRWGHAADPVRASRWQYLRARLAVLDAELAVRTGDAARAESALAEAEALCTRRGYRREHAAAALVSVALAQLAGDLDRARYWAGVTAARAAGIAADIEATAAQLLQAPGEGARPGVAHAAWAAWIDRLDLAAPRSFRLRDPTAVRYLTQRQADAIRFADRSFGVDAVRQTIHIGGTTRSLARRPGLWSVLSALLTDPSRVLSPDELSQHAWGVGYHAVRHRSRLVVSIKRLRDALGDDVITAAGGGYRLSVQSWAVLEPLHRS